MYYFDILAILEEHEGNYFTTLEIYAMIGEKRPAELNTIRSVLHKMFLRHPNIYRDGQQRFGFKYAFFK